MMPYFHRHSREYADQRQSAAAIPDKCSRPRRSRVMIQQATLQLDRVLDRLALDEFDGFPSPQRRDLASHPVHGQTGGQTGNPHRKQPVMAANGTVRDPSRRIDSTPCKAAPGCKYAWPVIHRQAEIDQQRRDDRASRIPHSDNRLSPANSRNQTNFGLAPVLFIHRLFQSRAVIEGIFEARGQLKNCIGT